METKYFFTVIFIFLLHFQIVFADYDFSSKKRMVADLDIIKNEFQINYAPMRWKKQHMDWDLEREIAIAGEKILSSDNLTCRDYQQIMRDLFNSMQDMHVGVNFYSTEFSVLPFLVQGVDNRYFVIWRDDSWAEAYGIALQPGDEIVSFNGRPLSEIVQEIKLSAFGVSESESYQRLSEMQLTMREGNFLKEVPQGSVAVDFKKKGNGRRSTFYVDWRYIPEEINNHFESYSFYPIKQPLGKHSFFRKMRALPLYYHLPKEIQSREYEGKLLGSKKSYFPPVGKVVWTPVSDTFNAYMCTMKNGKVLGYIRIPAFDGDTDEIAEFQSIITTMQARTQALIIDVMNNPGGFAFYTYAIASMLTDKPLRNLREEMAITQEDVFFAVQDAEVLNNINSDQDAIDALGPDICGYTVNLRMAQSIRAHANFIVDQFRKGQFNTDLFFLEGLEYIYPHPQTRYTKPLFILTNSLSISCADLLPALLQDNKRARIIGTKTAGAGGYVLTRKYSNRFGVADFSLTGSLMFRMDGRPLENLAVQPDIPYQFSIRDYTQEFDDFIQLINKCVN